MKTADRQRVQNAILAVTCVVYTVLLLQALFFKLVSPGELFDIGGRVRAFNFIPFGGSEYIYAIKKDVIINTMLFAALGFALYDISSKLAKGSEKLDSVYYTAMLCVCCIVLACFIVGNWHRLTH